MGSFLLSTVCYVRESSKERAEVLTEGKKLLSVTGRISAQAQFSVWSSSRLVLFFFLNRIILGLSKVQPYCAFKCCTTITSGITGCKQCRFVCMCLGLMLEREQSILQKGDESIMDKGQ